MVLWGLAAGYVVVRVVAVTSLPPVTSPDSLSYLALDWSGRGRPFPVPAFYALFPTDAWRIGAQAAFAGAAWAYAAWVVAQLARSRLGRAAAGAAVIAVGSSPVVAFWDRAIYSESLATSLAVLAVGALVRWSHRRHAGWLALGAAALALWGLARASNLPVAALAAAVLAVVAIARRREAAVAAVVVTAAVAAGAGLAARAEGGVAVSRADIRAQLGRSEIEPAIPNLLGVIETRIAPHPDRLAWFRRRGLPPPPAEPDYLADAPMRLWAADRGQSAYLTFLLTHPRYTLAPAARFRELLAPEGRRGSNVDDHRPPPSTPSVLARPLVSHLGLFLAAAGLALALAVAARGWRFAPVVAAAVVLLATWPHALVVWHGATAEHERLSVTNVAVSRLAVVALLAATAGSLGTSRVRRASPSAPTPAP